ncbi:hypothetical protein FA95DRAFT_1610446 [Auriscalpium vulgare]|uniref:Uncharacterized protein n=1 Tax=Auriscalpium vulgare TaxID=40419 RepID=A0ACB8RDF7_9AGAM|nr:hypothetical protein FA95DRAFT_1610446 [Auriscalpium vulgare]
MPVRPSAKALGKRRVIEQEKADQAFNLDDIFYERTDAGRFGPPPHEDSNSADSDSDHDASRTHHPHVHYVYDAVAKRPQRSCASSSLRRSTACIESRGTFTGDPVTRRRRCAARANGFSF